MVDSEDFDLISCKTLHKESFEYLRSRDMAPAWNLLPEQGGILWEVGCHLAYLQLHFLPDIDEVYAIGNKVKYPVYDNFYVMLRTSSKNVGLIELSWTSKETEIVYELCSSDEKRMQIYRDYNCLLERNENPPLGITNIVKTIFIDELRLLSKWKDFGFNWLGKGKIFPHIFLISSYIESLKNDLPSPVPPEAGKKAVRLLECIVESVNEKKPVSLNI